MALRHREAFRKALAFFALREACTAKPGAGERVKAMQCSSRGPTRASSLPVKAARALSAKSLESQTSCQAACSTSGLHRSLQGLFSGQPVPYRNSFQAGWIAAVVYPGVDPVNATRLSQAGRSKARIRC